MHKFCGTYDFCANCEQEQNCCTGKFVDLPIFTNKEVDFIANKYNIDPKLYIGLRIGDVSQVKKSKDGCFFYQGNKCLIYKDRPFDCRLFPFDLKKNDDNSIDLILYTNACPDRIIIDISNYTDRIIEDIKSILSSVDCLNDYLSKDWSQLLNGKKYIVIKKSIEFVYK